jgi:hypothetical protein
MAIGCQIPPQSPAIAQSESNAGIAGSWTGDFGAGVWTFKFSNANGDWSGVYSYPQHAGWNPLVGLSVSSVAAHFSIKATTDINFDLKLVDKSSLSGTVKFAHGSGPGSAPVIVPVHLKRN